MPCRAAPGQISGTIWLNSSFGMAHTPAREMLAREGVVQILTEVQGLVARRCVRGGRATNAGRRNRFGGGSQSGLGSDQFSPFTVMAVDSAVSVLPPQTALKPAFVFPPHTAELAQGDDPPHTADWSPTNALPPQTAEALQLAEPPHTAEESLTK